MFCGGLLMPRLRAGEFPGIHVQDVFLDGNLVEHVTELDTDEGWVRCLLGHTGEGVEVNEILCGRVTFTWRAGVEMAEVMVLHGRRGTYHLARRGLSPACRSQDEIAGYHYSMLGLVTLPPGAGARLCEKCSKLISVVLPTGSVKKLKEEPK